MKNGDIILGVIAIFLLLGLVGSCDLDAQERAEAHAQEARIAAKAAAKQLARDLRWKGLLDEADRMTFPVQAYSGLSK